MRSIAAAALLLAAVPAAAAPSVEASGSATVRAAPDRAVIRLGVEARGPDAGTAQGRAAQALQGVLGALKKQGVPLDRIATDRIDLYPFYEPDREGGQHLAGYRAATLLRIVVPLTGKGEENDLGRIVDAAIKGGANQLEGIGFELADDAPLRQKALKAAAVEAKARAAAITSALGAQLGALISASDGGAEVGPPPRPYMMMEKSAAADTQVLPGAVEVTASVHVQYAIAP
jgi:uncharacterized protein YggE